MLVAVEVVPLRMVVTEVTVVGLQELLMVVPEEMPRLTPVEVVVVGGITVEVQVALVVQV
jgi:hypothetical protein